MTPDRLLSLLTLALSAFLFTVTPLQAQPVEPAETPELQSPERRAEFEKNRIKHISEVAKLTEEERSIVVKELVTYDANKLKHFRESMKIRKQLENEDLSDEQAGALLSQVLKLDEQRTTETTKLFGRLKGKLPDSKLAKVYAGLKGYSGSVGRKIRRP